MQLTNVYNSGDVAVVAVVAVEGTVVGAEEGAVEVAVEGVVEGVVEDVVEDAAGVVELSCLRQ